MRMLGSRAPSQLPQFTAVRPDLLQHRLTNTLELQTIVFSTLPPNANLPLSATKPLLCGCLHTRGVFLPHGLCLARSVPESSYG